MLCADCVQLVDASNEKPVLLFFHLKFERNFMIKNIARLVDVLPPYAATITAISKANYNNSFDTFFMEHFINIKIVLWI